ncbi:UDP-N-acetylmuramoyl-tripeptide--D-alanyl-D-alanine ligase [Pelagibaculum spongiae]|uniref:UDP-N-acetylmuramoyl-tripeptide--D-alanyl-D-alanine ligase n=1 Tax=Pelagibaculum spongiae TaxID=2080658 RepID=A0A2V1H530_9GAMM|nr:UDP-N-acetylmuramoyl-tripeptide--D-alanyl-D-alanine ligase [Pelagibaculum spongiae]PVZ71875.1 UDP-N-acetylmuramoyl-tripeptide--D-alanyl-D-alanine ligase [Pelagibaculum spongiae]
MFNASLADMAKMLRAELTADVQVTGVSIDTRTITSGNLFVAIAGDRFDGHNFAEKAAQLGAAALLVERKLDVDLPMLIVPDATLALGRIARWWRRQLDLKVVGITGSCGKTSVKEMLASILSGQDQTLATKGNLNNHLGVPLTLLQLSEQDRYAVIEMGANHVGEIEYLTGLAKPDVALVNNVAAAHLSGFGSLQGVARAKGEIYQSLRGNDVALINDDDQYASYFSRLVNCHESRFGLGAGARVTADQIKIQSNGCYQFQLVMPEGSYPVKLSLPGQHQINNALAAASAARALKIAPEIIVAGLQRALPVSGRLRPIELSDGSLILDDSYNANPDSVKAAIDVALELAKHRQQKSLLLLGDMAELGERADELHYQVGVYARKKGLNGLLSVGKLSAKAARGFLGKQRDTNSSFSDQQSLVEAARKQMSVGAVVLVKGSRSAAMDQVVSQLSEGTN